MSGIQKQDICTIEHWVTNAIGDCLRLQGDLCKRMGWNLGLKLQDCSRHKLYQCRMECYTHTEKYFIYGEVKGNDCAAEHLYRQHNPNVNVYN